MDKKVGIIAGSIVAVFLVAFFLYKMFARYEYETIKIGILHSRTGSLALSEEPVIDATILAIKELNEAGGLLGKTIEPVIVDGKSDWPTFAKLAEKLIVEDKVAVIFGCWTSASRKSVKPVVERYKHLLFYPVQYEGVEQSPHIIYTGAAPNQQIFPAVSWCMKNIGKTFFLVGSDYIFPRMANETIKELVTALGGSIVGEEYLLLGATDVKPVMNKIKESKPEIIINTINGDTNISFFKNLNSEFNKNIPVMSLSISEPEIELIGIENLVGTYVCWSYFQSLSTQENKSFVTSLKVKYGKNTLVNDPMEAAYFGVKLWAKAVEKAGTTQVATILKQLPDVVYLAPEGMVQVAENHHTWKTVRIGKVQKDGQFESLWESNNPVKPEPYPSNTILGSQGRLRTQKNWEDLVGHYYTLWGNKWSAG